MRGREHDSYNKDDDRHILREILYIGLDCTSQSAHLAGKCVNVYSQFTYNTNDLELQDIDIE